MTMIMIFRLPDDIMLSVICDWLDVTSLCKCDTSLCNKQNRYELLNLYKLDYSVIKNSKPNFHNYIDWIKSKQIKFKSFFGLEKLEDTDNLQYTRDTIKYYDNITFSSSGFGWHVKYSPTARRAMANNFKTMTNCKNLTNCTLTCFCLTDVSMMEFASCEKLINLTINFRDKQVTDKSLVLLPKNWKNLKSLKIIGDYKNFTDLFVLEIAKYCKDLTNFVIYSDNDVKITDVSLMELGQKCTNLTNFSIDCRGKVGVSDLSIIEFATCCKKLTSFNINTNNTDSAITDTGLLQIATKCKHLTSLTIGWYKNINISSFSVAKILENCDKLKKFTIFCKGDENLIDKSIVEIVKKSEILETFYISYLDEDSFPEHLVVNCIKFQIEWEDNP
jgi:hypothetical protein